MMNTRYDVYTDEDGFGIVDTFTGEIICSNKMRSTICLIIDYYKRSGIMPAPQTNLKVCTPVKTSLNMNAGMENYSPLINNKALIELQEMYDKL